MKQAVMYIEYGHLRIGPNIVKNPAFLVTRSMEDHITWVDLPKLREQSKNTMTDWTTLTYYKHDFVVQGGYKS